MINTRLLTFNALMRVEKDKSYSNLTLDSYLKNTELDARDKSFVSALFYGIIERKLTLDYNLGLYLDKPLKKLKPEVLVILRLGAYQILFMDKVPMSAAVNESVKLSKKCGCSFASGLINALLRKVGQNGLVLPDKSNISEFLSVKYSCNAKLCEKFISRFGFEAAEDILEASVDTPDIYVRVNTLKLKSGDLIEIFQNENISAEPCDVENALKIKLRGKDIEALDSYKNGYFHVQDLASQYCAKALDAQSGDVVYDLCSAPGGKAYTTAERMNNSGVLLCFDLYESRVNLIKSGAERLGIDIIKCTVSDATEFHSEFAKADRVLCDVPCSGFGIIRRKPEIKYKSPDEFSDLPEIQYQILCNGAQYVKKDGTLVYSTCTLLADENENVCRRFLENHPEFTAYNPLSELSDGEYTTLLPQKDGSDGFFIACFKRNEIN